MRDLTDRTVRHAATALAVAVVAAGCGGAGGRGASPAPSASSPSSPSASPSVLPADGRRLAFVTGRTVSVRGPDGTVTRVGPADPAMTPSAVAWTRDGSALTWIEYGRDGSSRVVLHRLADGSDVVSDPAASDSEYPMRLDDLPPLSGVHEGNLVRFGVEGGRLVPSDVALHGVPVPEPPFVSVVAALPGRLLLGVPIGTGEGGGPTDEYVVTADGKGTLAFRAAKDDNVPVSTGTATRQGDRVAYVTGVTSGACGVVESVSLRRTSDWHALPPPLLPLPPRNSHWQVLALRYGEDDRLFAVLDAVTDKCASASGPVLYELVGRSFTPRRAGIVWGASAADGALATIAAAAPLANGVPQPGPGVLEVTKAGGKPVRVASGVTEAVWSPA